MFHFHNGYMSKIQIQHASMVLEFLRNCFHKMVRQYYNGSGRNQRFIRSVFSVLR